jgi:hypothetical protein
MARMPTRRSPIAVLAAGLLVVSLAVAACGSSVPSVRPSAPSPTSPSTPGPTPAATASPTRPSLTPVPGAPSDDPIPPPDNTGTTETEWGTILDGVPDDFPRFPGAEPAGEFPAGPVSGGWTAQAPVDEVATWYERELGAQGYAVDVGSPLEDGSRVADITTDLPECRIQLTFQPAGESTMILVLYGAGCRPGGL